MFDAAGCCPMRMCAECRDECAPKITRDRPGLARSLLAALVRSPATGQDSRQFVRPMGSERSRLTARGGGWYRCDRRAAGPHTDMCGRIFEPKMRLLAKPQIRAEPAAVQDQPVPILGRDTLFTAAIDAVLRSGSVEAAKISAPSQVRTATLAASSAPADREGGGCPHSSAFRRAIRAA
jgi:hypothetical protein